MEQKIERFLIESLSVEFDENVTAESNLFQLGLIDSYGYMELLKFLETEFQVTLTDEELFSNVLVSLTNMVNFIRKKKAIPNSGYHQPLSEPR
jgi:acyl carrier protein